MNCKICDEEINIEQFETFVVIQPDTYVCIDCAQLLTQMCRDRGL